MGRNCRSLCLAVALGLLAISTGAFAQDKLSRARARFEQGEAYFKAETYDKAIVEYQAAFDLVGRPLLLFNIGLCHEKLGDFGRAIAFYDRYLSVEATGNTAVEARARRTALERKQAQAEKARAEKQAAADALAAGQAALAAKEHKKAIELLTTAYAKGSGPEALYLLAEAYYQSGDLLLAESEYRRYMEKSPTGRHRTDASARIREIETARANQQISERLPQKQTGPRRQRRTLIPAYVAFGSAALAATIAAAIGRNSASTLDELDAQLESGVPPVDSGDPRFTAGRNDAARANTVFVVAGALAAVGVGFTVWALIGKEVPADEQATLQIIPSYDGERSSVLLGGRF